MQQFSHLPDQQILEGDTNPSGIASGRTSELLWQSFVNKGEAQSSFSLYGVDSQFWRLLKTSFMQVKPNKEKLSWVY